jgi:hypothetical protein
MKSHARSTGEYLRDNQGYRFFWTLIVFARSGRKVYPAMTRMVLHFVKKRSAFAQVATQSQWRPGKPLIIETNLCTN